MSFFPKVTPGVQGGPVTADVYVAVQETNKKPFGDDSGLSTSAAYRTEVSARIAEPPKHVSNRANVFATKFEEVVSVPAEATPVQAAPEPTPAPTPAPVQQQWRKQWTPPTESTQGESQ